MRYQMLTVLMVLALASCRLPSLYFVDPSGPPEYKLGWEDGCDTGQAAAGSAVERAFFGFKKRPELADNELYKTAWNEGFSYCRFATDPVDKGGWYD